MESVGRDRRFPDFPLSLNLDFLGTSLVAGLDQADSPPLPAGFPVVLGSSVSISPFVNQHRNKYGP